MSALFNGSNYLSKVGSPITGNAAFTMAIWVKLTAAVGCALSACSSSAQEAYGLHPHSDNNLYFMAYVGSDAYANKASYSDGVWTLMIGTSSGTTNRVPYIGASAGTADTTSRTFTALDRLAVGGRFLSGGMTTGYTGRSAEPAFWSGVMSGPNIAALAAGDSPSIVDAGNLLFHESLLSGAGTLTNTGTVTFSSGDHPTINTGGGGGTFRRRIVCIGF